jgi:O-antigen/teichoic acid export membrane protein
MNKPLEIKSSLLAKNIFLNIIGRVVPLIVAVVTVPYVIHGLGAARFGILSIAWVVIGYFSMFDMGLGRSTTKFVAEALGKGETKSIPTIVWTSLTSQLLIGVLGSIVLAVITPALVERVLNIPPELTAEAKTTFYLLCFSIPVVICSISLRGVLEAAQRFDLVNAVTIPSNCLNFLLPAIGLFWGLGLPGIIVLLIISRAGTAGAYLMLCFLVYPQIRQLFLIDLKILRLLFSFGGWITICAMLGTTLMYLDRFFIGTLYAIADVGYYSVSADMLTHFGVLPGSFAKTLFPAFSALESDKDKLKQLYVRSLKYILLIMGPIVLVLIVFAGDILHLWLGAEWASKTTLVFQILAVGLFFNSLTHMPGNLLDGVGRPDLRAKIFLLGFVPYILLLWFLIGKFGVVGAALAFTFRGCLDSFLFFCIGWKIIGLNQAVLIENGMLRSVMVYGGLVTITLFLIAILGNTLLIQSITTFICLIFFALITWKYVLDMDDKQPLFLTMKRIKGV